MDLILYAIPVFFLLIFIELGYGLWRGRNTYRINDSINSLSLGSLSRLQGLVFLGFSAGIYEWVVQQYQLAQLPTDSAWVWISCFVGYDLAYYWKHRFGHEVALFWGSHVAHHQSEDYNLSTALRQTSIDFYGFLFYLPFFFLGYPAEVLFSVASLNLIYQFWVHTEHVPKLGPLEWVLVTPSNHRVHHARNEIYVDRNYGGVFIVWDRLFGSFQEELDHEPVAFGLRKPLNSWNPVWANIHVYWRLLLDWWQAPGLLNKLKLPFMPPGWQPEGLQSRCAGKASLDLHRKFNPELSPFASYYALAQFILVTAISLFVLLNSPAWLYQQNVVGVAALTLNLMMLGYWLENRRHAQLVELLRLVILALACAYLPMGPLWQQAIALLAAASAALVCLAKTHWLPGVLGKSRA